jgi:hypothetical protein
MVRDREAPGSNSGPPTWFRKLEPESASANYKDGPGWYVVVQVFVGLIQFVIALAMLAGYRKAGAWGGF